MTDETTKTGPCPEDDLIAAIRAAKDRYDKATGKKADPLLILDDEEHE
ncbi:hypothetical protein [Martelella alba]|nr:hypothetical protein [Martelella alba]